MPWNYLSESYSECTKSENLYVGFVKAGYCRKGEIAVPERHFDLSGTDGFPTARQVVCKTGFLMYVLYFSADRSLFCFRFFGFGFFKDKLLKRGTVFLHIGN